MIQIFSLYDDNFCDLVCVTFCMVRRCFESDHLVPEYGHPQHRKDMDPLERVQRRPQR